jgi:2'-5' RNA ligase
MRLFVAVEVSDAVRAWATRVRREIERATPSAASGLRWVAPGHMHLTLRFIGEVEPRRAASISEAFVAGVPGQAFDMELDRVQWIPPSGPPRVLVSPIGRGAEHLQALRIQVDAMLRRTAGVGPEDRPLLAHVTLARVRDHAAPQVKLARSAVLKAGGEGPASVVAVTRVLLLRSELSPRGPTYTELAVASLAGEKPLAAEEPP